MTTHTDEPRIKKNEAFFLIALTLVAILLVCLAIIPQTRQNIKKLFISQDRKIIAKVDGHLLNTDKAFTVLKIKEGSKLTVELYSPDEEGNLTLLNRTPLYDSRDGYLHVRDSATNLAIMDVDKDGVNEVIAPTYDDQMVPRLNIFKYNSDSNSLDRVAAPEDFKY